MCRRQVDIDLYTIGGLRFDGVCPKIEYMQSINFINLYNLFIILYFYIIVVLCSMWSMVLSTTPYPTVAQNTLRHFY